MTTLSNLPQSEAITIYRGDTLVLTVTPKVGRVVEDLTGVTALMKLKASVDSESTLYTFNTVVDQELGTITASIQASDWSTITWTGGVYDLQITYPSGVVKTLVRGTLTVEKDVS